MAETAPWRGTQRRHFPGVPAWGLSTRTYSPASFAVSAFPDITPEWAWQGSDGAGVRLCVVDSGIDGSHPQVAPIDRSVTVQDTDGGGLEIVDCEPTDTAGHGTACAGIIRSIAPAVSLSSARILTDGKSGSGAALLAGLRWVIDEGFDVINLSVSTTRPEFAAALHDLADRAYFRRTLLVVSAHNMPVTSFPWTYSSVVSVASHDEPDPMLFYYNPAPPVEFYARGVQVPVAWPGGKTLRSTGNSFAAPHIAGICALILSKHPQLAPFQVKAALFLSARNVAGQSGDSDAS
jgi:subtilisin family serine protease